MPGAQCTRSLVCELVAKNAHEYSQRRHRKSPGIPARNGFTDYFVLSPAIGYSIHTFWSLRVVPYLMRRKASRPIRMTFGPGFP
jgi:hypothetical protein